MDKFFHYLEVLVDSFDVVDPSQVLPFLVDLDVDDVDDVDSFDCVVTSFDADGLVEAYPVASCQIEGVEASFAEVHPSALHYLAYVEASSYPRVDVDLEVLVLDVHLAFDDEGTFHFH